MLQKRWNIKENSDPKAVLALADSLNIPLILAQLLLSRNVTNYFEAKSYFRPSLDTLYDPFLMNGMEAASNRVISAITSNEKIYIFGDYDVDGTCAVAILLMFLRELGANVEVYIPNRLTEGYGISCTSIDYLHKNGANLIISVDCGITAVDEVDHAKSYNMDVIICDHHQPKEKLPDAFAILDPLKPSCNYPFKYLSGAGVAFKLARAVADKIGRKDMALDYLDLVALAGAADIVPLIDENRVLVRKGIDLINSNPRPGIRALIKSARMEPGNLSAGQIVFTIAPRINAVGRLGDAGRAVELFTTDSFSRAEELAQILEGENFARRKIDEVTLSHAISLVEDEIDLNHDLGIVLHHDDWHPGVIGIVASRLVEKYYRPSIMLTTIDGVAKGSARSITGFNIYEAIEHCKDLLLQFGGHQAAAGLAIELDKVAEFRTKFNEILKQNLNKDDIIPDISIDAQLSLSDITPKFVRILDQFAPFGPKNMRPVFLTKDITFSSYPRIVGTNHLITSVRQNGMDKTFDVIGFNLGQFVNLIDKEKNSADIVYTIEKIVKDGRTYPQLRLKDIKIKPI